MKWWTARYPRTGRRWLRNARCDGPRECSFGPVRSHDQLPSPSLFLNDEPSQSGTLVAAMTLVSGSSTSGPGSGSWLVKVGQSVISYPTPPRRPVAHPRPRPGHGPALPAFHPSFYVSGSPRAAMPVFSAVSQRGTCHRTTRKQGRTWAWAVWAMFTESNHGRTCSTTIGTDRCREPRMPTGARGLADGTDEQD